MNISFNPSNQARETQTLQVEMVRRVFNNEVIEVDTWLSSQTDGDIYALRPRIRQKMDDARFVCFFVAMKFYCVSMNQEVIILHTSKKMQQKRINVFINNKD